VALALVLPCCLVWLVCVLCVCERVTWGCPNGDWLDPVPVLLPRLASLYLLCLDLLFCLILVGGSCSSASSPRGVLVVTDLDPFSVLVIGGSTGRVICIVLGVKKDIQSIVCTPSS
jgi:hypothetical protein